MSFRRRMSGLAGFAVAASLLLACGSQSSAINNDIGKGAAMGFALHTTQWKAGENIPVQFTCDGDNVSPPLQWDGAPAGTQSYSLVVEDPDAPGGTFIHWVLYDLPAGAKELPKDVSKQENLADGARQGRNSFGHIGYGGPCPPPGPAHRYYFRLYALDQKPALDAGAKRADLERAMRGHILAQTEFMGRYQRR